MDGKIIHVNPNGLLKSSLYSQVGTTRGNGTTIYIGGQNAINSNGEVIGIGDIHTQTIQVMFNIKTALAACGASFENIVKLTIYIVQGQDISTALQASQRVVSFVKPPAISVLTISGVTNPDYLIEVDTVAFITE